MGEPAGRAATPTAALTSDEGAALVRLASDTVGRRLRSPRSPDVRPRPPGPPILEALRAIGSSFVTLEVGDELRGCIGTLDPVRPLYLDVVRNAVRAMADPRLPPVTAKEWHCLDVSVSVLTRPESIPAASRDQLLAGIVPGRHGILLTDGRSRSTFLPVVWAKLPDPYEFVNALLRKGGWDPDNWPDGLRAGRYATIEFHDPSPRPTL